MPSYNKAKVTIQIYKMFSKHIGNDSVFTLVGQPFPANGLLRDGDRKHIQRFL